MGAETTHPTTSRSVVCCGTSPPLAATCPTDPSPLRKRLYWGLRVRWLLFFFLSFLPEVLLLEKIKFPTVVLSLSCRVSCSLL